MEETPGYYTTVMRIKPTATPPDGVNKVVYYDDDYEEVEEFTPYSKEIVEASQQQAEKNEKIQELPDKVDTIETTQDQIILAMADMIGGANEN